MSGTITITLTALVLSAITPEMEPSQGGRPVMQRAQVGRASVREGTATMNGPFVSSTLPPTGHVARFKKYPEVQMDSQSSYSGFGSSTGTSGATGGALSPYLNFARGGNTLTNYLSFQRDQQIYNTGAQTQQINSQLRQAAESRPMRQATQPFVQNIDTTPTPLQRRFQPQETGGLVSGSSAEELAVLREILRELKALREGTAPDRPDRTEQKPDLKPQEP